MSFMADPARVFKSYLKATAAEDRWYQYGMLAMALEIITRIKLLEDLPVTTEVGRQESIVCLQTMLTEIGISDMAYEWYDKLAEWRKPKFRRLSAFERLEQQLLHAEPSDAPDGQLRQGFPRSAAALLASESEARLPELSRLGLLDAPSVGRRSLGDVPTSASEEEPSEASEATPSE